VAALMAYLRLHLAQKFFGMWFGINQVQISRDLRRLLPWIRQTCLHQRLLLDSRTYRPKTAAWHRQQRDRIIHKTAALHKISRVGLCSNSLCVEKGQGVGVVGAASPPPTTPLSLFAGAPLPQNDVLHKLLYGPYEPVSHSSSFWVNLRVP